MPNIKEYIANIQNTDQWQDAEAKAQASQRLDEAAKNTTLTNAQFAETYQFRVITEMLPKVLRKVGLDKNADECQNSKDLGTAKGNAEKAYDAACNAAFSACDAALDAASYAASYAANWAAYDAASYVAYWAAKDQKDAILTQYVDLMMEILENCKRVARPRANTPETREIITHKLNLLPWRSFSLNDLVLLTGKTKKIVSCCLYRMIRAGEVQKENGMFEASILGRQKYNKLVGRFQLPEAPEGVIEEVKSLEEIIATLESNLATLREMVKKLARTKKD